MIQQHSLIDVHHHVVLPEYTKALIRAGATDPSKPQRQNSERAQALEAMANLGITGAVVNPLSVAGVHHGNDEAARYLTSTVNDALAAFVDGLPHVGFFATLPLPDVAGSLKEIERSLDGLHADGVILLSNQNGVHIGEPEWHEVYAELDRRGTPVLIHPTRPPYINDLKLKLWPAILEYPFETTRVAANLIYNGIVQKYPNINWILAHAGGCLPYLRHRLNLMEETDEHRPTFKERHPEGIAPALERFWYDTAIAGSDPALAALYKVADPARVLFGSDWPYIHNGDVKGQIKIIQAKLESAKLDQLAFKNAGVLFKRFSLSGDNGF